jgi:hypothetical protein
MRHGFTPLSLPRADFTDAIVTRTRIDLTLEQFVTTWNYKTGVFKTFKGMTLHSSATIDVQRIVV